MSYDYSEEDLRNSVKFWRLNVFINFFLIEATCQRVDKHVGYSTVLGKTDSLFDGSLEVNGFGEKNDNTYDAKKATYQDELTGWWLISWIFSFIPFTDVFIARKALAQQIVKTRQSYKETNNCDLFTADSVHRRFILTTVFPTPGKVLLVFIVAVVLVLLTVSALLALGHLGAFAVLATALHITAPSWLALAATKVAFPFVFLAAKIASIPQLAWCSSTLFSALVAGVAGYVGSWMVRELLQPGSVWKLLSLFLYKTDTRYSEKSIPPFTLREELGVHKSEDWTWIVFNPRNLLNPFRAMVRLAIIVNYFTFNQIPYTRGLTNLIFQGLITPLMAVALVVDLLFRLFTTPASVGTGTYDIVYPSSYGTTVDDLGGSDKEEYMKLPKADNNRPSAVPNKQLSDPPPLVAPSSSSLSSHTIDDLVPPTDDPPLPPPPLRDDQIRAMYSFKPDEHTSKLQAGRDYLAFSKGEVLTRLDNSTEEYWLVKNADGEQGHVPNNYFEIPDSNSDNETQNSM